MYFKTRDAEAAFLKRLWRGEETLCPKCGGAALVLLHKKAKKSDCDRKCPECGEIYRTVRMLKEQPDR